MKKLDRATTGITSQRPVKVLQFGGGNFLRAFVDWMIHEANRSGYFNGDIAIVQSSEQSKRAESINQQDGLYHVILQGIKDEKPVREITRVESVREAVNINTDYDKYLQFAMSPELKFIISNTTEAGIVWDNTDSVGNMPPRSFPCKMAALLKQRFDLYYGDPSQKLVIICCELIDNNADRLKTLITKHADKAQWGDTFKDWVEETCLFCNSLVDRIVSGFPQDNIDAIQQEIGFEDRMIVVGEMFHLWAIEAPKVVRELFPLDKAGLNVVFLDDLIPFRNKKVKILNGAHTALAPIGLLAGKTTVKEAIEDNIIGQFLVDMIQKEVLPTIAEDRQTLLDFSTKILERFRNPYIKHCLSSISLNSISKWKTRNLPTLLDYIATNGQIPPRTALSLAALIVMYEGNEIALNDEPETIAFCENIWEKYRNHYLTLCRKILSHSSFWGQDLTQIPDLADFVAQHIEYIKTQGIIKVIQNLRF